MFELTEQPVHRRVNNQSQWNLMKSNGSVLTLDGALHGKIKELSY